MPNPDVSAVADDDVVVPGGGGMSVAPADARLLPQHRRPGTLGGTGRDPVWSLDVTALPAELQVRQDKPAHALLEPTRSMTLREFQAALARTQKLWKLFCR